MRKFLLKNAAFIAAASTIAITPLVLVSCSFTRGTDPQPEPQPEPEPEPQPEPEPEPVEQVLTTIMVNLPETTYWLQEGSTRVSDDPIEIACFDQEGKFMEAKTIIEIRKSDGTEAPDWIWIDENNNVNIKGDASPAEYGFYLYVRNEEDTIHSNVQDFFVEIVGIDPIAPDSIKIVCKQTKPTVFYTATGDVELDISATAGDIPEEMICKDCNWELKSITGKKQNDLAGQKLFKLVNTDGKEKVVISSNVDASYIGVYSVTIKATSQLDSFIFDEITLQFNVVDGFYFYDSNSKLTYTRKSLNENWTLSLMDSSNYTLSNVASSLYNIPVTTVAANFCANSGVMQLSSVILPTSITTIGEKAFINQLYMYSLAMPGVKVVGNSAFEDCINVSFLRNYDQPVLQSVGNKAFCNCSSLNFSDSITHELTTIGDNAFSWTPITTIKLGISVKNIGVEPFSYCSSLKYIHVSAVNPPKLAGALYSGTTDLQGIRVPSNLVETYKKAAGWSAYSGIIAGI